MIEPINLKPFTKFCMTIGMLPSSYKESLTYEEQLLWLCDYIENTVIPAINNNAEALTEVQNLYVELKSYVDNYFENLDVQEEINNKLDEMAENGQLENIISLYLNTNAIFHFINVNSLKNSNNVTDGMYVKTMGYNSFNDGGGSFYKIRTITNQDVVDNATIIPLNNDNLIAELQIDNNLNPIQFGCVGDGETDDTENLRKCISYCQTNKINFISFSNKIFGVTDTIYLSTNNTNFDFNGSTIKALNNPNSGHLISFTTNYVTNYNLKNLIIDCNNLADYGFYMNWGWSSLVENIFIKNPNICGMYIYKGQIRMKNLKVELDTDINREITGLYNEGGNDSTFENIITRNCQIGIRNNASACEYINCHPVMFNTNLIPNSKGFYLEATTNLINPYADTYQYGFYITNSGGHNIINPKHFVNTDYYNNETMSVNPTFMYFTQGVEATQRMTVIAIKSLNTSSPIGDGAFIITNKDRWYGSPLLDNSPNIVWSNYNNVPIETHFINNRNNILNSLDNVSGNNFILTLSNKIIEISINGLHFNDTVSADTTIVLGTIPDKYKPLNAKVICLMSTTGKLCSLSILDTGVIRLTPREEFTSSDIITDSAFYIL